MKKQIEIHKIDISSSLPLQFADEGIKAGFPSPAQDYMEQAIDLNKELIRHPGVYVLRTCDGRLDERRRNRRR